MADFTPGTRDWFYGESIYGVRGKVDACLCLFEQGKVSRSRCRKLIQAVVKMRGDYDAPWDELDWSGGDTEILTGETDA